MFGADVETVPFCGRLIRDTVLYPELHWPPPPGPETTQDAAPAASPPELPATVGALSTTWVTFIPSLVLIFPGAPSIERLCNNHYLTSAPKRVTAVVVDVNANVALYFVIYAVSRHNTVSALCGSHRLRAIQG